MACLVTLMCAASSSPPSAPTQVGEGGPPRAAGWWRGRGPRRFSLRSSPLSLRSSPRKRGPIPACAGMERGAGRDACVFLSPRRRGEVHKLPRSRDAPSHPSFASRFKKALRASLKRREAERRQAHHWFPPRRRKKSLPAYAARTSSPPARIGAGLKAAARSPFGAPPRSCAEGLTLDSAPGRASWNHRIQTGGPSPAPVQPAPGSPVTRRTVDAQNRPDAGYKPASGNRTRPIDRLSPVDVPSMGELRRSNDNGDGCQGGVAKMATALLKPSWPDCVPAIHVFGSFGPLRPGCPQPPRA